MIHSSEFLQSILDTLTINMTVIDKQGNIVFVNQKWIQFAQSNSCSLIDDWTTINYLTICDASAKMGDSFGLKVAKGIRKVINEEEPNFIFEYPCHSPDEKRWYMMCVTPFQIGNNIYFTVAHHNITKRRFAEENIREQSHLDGLTHLFNRQYFDDFLKREWKRCARLKQPITLAILDLDYFKMVNDTYGHIVGDEYLKKIASLIKKYTKRPTDICARYGGEEFAIVLGNTDTYASLTIINKIIKAIAKLELPNKNSLIKPTLTLSVGVSTLFPTSTMNEKILLKLADDLLYDAKRNGRNQVASS